MNSLQKKILHATMVLQKRYAEGDLQIKHVAKEMGMSPSYFSVVFKEHMGVTPRSYLVQYRLELSTTFLRESSRPIESIALLIGFQSISHFTQCFRKKYGIPPSVYRQHFSRSPYLKPPNNS